MNLILPSRLLRTALIADACASGALALLQVSAAETLGVWLGLEPSLLLQTGVFLVGYTGVLIWLARSDRVFSSLIRLIVVGNVGWGAAAIGLLILDLAQPTALGIAFVLLQGAAVLAFALLQYLGLRSSVPTRGAAAAVAG